MILPSGNDWTGKTAILVDDDPLIGIDMTALVISFGVKVRGPFTTVQRAVQELRDATPDIGILDIGMGRNQTTEIVARMLESRKVPIIFVSGNADSTNLFNGDFPDSVLISKPVDPYLLENAIHRSIS